MSIIFFFLSFVLAICSSDVVMCQQAQVPEQTIDCAICLDDLRDGRVVTTLLCPTTNFESRHRFHAVCIKEAFKVKFECPICRAQEPIILTSDLVASKVKQCFDKLEKVARYKKLAKPVLFSAACAVVFWGVSSYFSRTIIPEIPFDRLQACKDGMLEFCSTEELCSLHHVAEACLECCKKGMLDMCTKEQLCSIHELWSSCPCTLEDARGCLRQYVFETIPQSKELFLFLASKLIKNPESVANVFT